MERDDVIGCMGKTMGGNMTGSYSPSRDVALRQVLQIGLALIDNEDVDPTRRGEVLRNLIGLFTDAKRGAAALSGERLLFAVEERSEFERFDLFFRYLQRSFGEELPTRIGETATVFGSLEKNESPAETTRHRAADFVRKLLLELDQERALTPLVEPRVLTRS